MFRKVAMSALTAAILAAAFPAASQTLVKEVEVEADIEALQNAPAAAHWTAISDDLENAIVARLVGMTADDGVKISVDIDTVELASSFQSAMGTAESKLKGRVNVTSDTDNTKFDTYDLTVGFEQAGPFFLPDTDLAAITTDSKEYYDAMITAFADSVVQRLR
ncbi:MAG: hypothetical protein R3E44_15670 [Paracoccaceae bacterium]